MSTGGQADPRCPRIGEAEQARANCHGRAAAEPCTGLNDAQCLRACGSGWRSRSGGVPRESPGDRPVKLKAHLAERPTRMADYFVEAERSPAQALEPGKYLSIRYTKRLAEAGAVTPVGSRGDSYDALAETIIGLYKTKLVRPAVPGRAWTMDVCTPHARPRADPPKSRMALTQVSARLGSGERGAGPGQRLLALLDEPAHDLGRRQDVLDQPRRL